MTKASYADIQWISGEQMPRSLGQVNVQMAEGVGFEPTREREPPGGFQDRCLKPLGHPSFAMTSMTYAVADRERIGNVATRWTLSGHYPPSAPLDNSAIASAMLVSAFFVRLAYARNITAGSCPQWAATACTGLPASNMMVTNEPRRS